MRVAQLAALNDAAGVVDALDSIDAGADQVVATLRRLRLGQLVLATLSPASSLADHPVAIRLHDSFGDASAVSRTDPAELLGAFVEIRDLFDEHGIPLLLLKGFVLAELLYGGLGHRPQHDVDLLVHRRDVRRGARVVESLGYERRGRDGHAVNLRRGGVHIDLHYRLRSAPAYAIDEKGAWQTARAITIQGVHIRTLSDEATLTLLATSLVEDAAFGMAKAKSLCDVWLLARHMDDTTDWEQWFSQRAEEGLEVVALNGTALAVMALDRADDAPNLISAVRRRQDRVCVRDQTHALDLVSAARGSAANMAWMGQIYPGWLVGFRLHPFVSGLPGSLRGLRSDWLPHQFDLLRSRRALRATR
jgi:hypothetical protein